jgi:hypothetical protein
MSTLVNALRTKNTVTENGMVTNSSSLSATLDLFFTIGAVRKSIGTIDGAQRIIGKFEAARNEDSLVTRKLLFWARDIRGGAGEREVFRVLLRHAAKNHPQDVIDNIELVSEFGRWDDLFCLFNTQVESEAIKVIVNALKEGNGLAAKWLPRLGGKVPDHKKHIANKVRSAMDLGPKEYRQMLVKLTNVVETPMCAKEFDKINYEHVPSVAMSRYSKAFGKNDTTRFLEYKESLSNGEAKINAGALYPYDVTKNLQHGDSDLANEQWKSLPNFMEGTIERVLPVCDVSGSMETSIGNGVTSAMDVCISLGLYISERNEGPFKDAFVTFSERPELQYLTGDLKSRFAQLQSADWGMSTDLEATFRYILDQGIKHKVSEEQMPTCILIMSDMEFNQATRRHDSAFDMIRRKYEEAGYTLPNIIFWNLCSRHDNMPVTKDDNGTALISGFSPSILKTVLSGNAMNPIQIMLDTINQPRYETIK